MDHRFRNTHRYAQTTGHRTGFATLEEGVDPNGWGLYHGVLIPGDHCDMAEPRRRDLAGNPDFNEIGDMFRAAHRYAQSRSYATGFPVFEQGVDASGQVVFGIALLKASIAVAQSIPAADIGTPAFGDPIQMGIRVHRYARSHGFFSGFPVYEQGIENGVLKYGVALVRLPAVEVIVLAEALSIFSRFRFDAGITPDLSNRLLERHAFAIGRIAACGNLTGDEKASLLAAYHKNIVHGTLNNPGRNAEAPISGDRIDVNFGVLFPQSHDEIAMTLIHEMMHCAGFTHPDRRDGLPPAPPTPRDTPGDNGQYYGTAPLRAEFCIAGRQSLVETGHRDCVIRDGRASIRGPGG